MGYSDWTIFKEITYGTLTSYDIDRWLWNDFSITDPVPRKMRYRHHPRVGPSNPQLLRMRYNKAFRGHRFKVGRSKK